MKAVIREDADLKEYALLEFKGKFAPEEAPEKQLLPLGQLFKVDDAQYRLEMGIMDLVGKAQPVKQPLAVFEKLCEGEQQRTLLIRGYIRTKVVFDRRPVPMMERSKRDKNADVLFPFARKP